MNHIEVTVEGLEEPSWTSKIPAFCDRILEKLSLDNWEVSIVFCSNEFIRELNHKFRGKDDPTDVLSFSQTEGESFPGIGPGPSVVGDIVVSLEMLEETSKDFDVTSEEELKRLIIHGLLHLAGHDHQDNSPEQPMLVKQEELLRAFSEERIF